MNKDYYQILGLKRDAKTNDIGDQYKRMVLRWHPRFAKQDNKTALYHFSQISQAYQVLSDPLKRTFYDKYGYLKLKQGMFAQGQLKGGYRFGNNPDEIFQKYFQNNNTLIQSVQKDMIQSGSLFGSAYGGLNYTKQVQSQPLVIQIPCQLYQLYCGVSKRIKYLRKVLNLDGRTTSVRQQQKGIQIRAGQQNGKTYIFKGEGNQNINRINSDLIFKIVQKNGGFYQRRETDLFLTVDLSLSDAISGKTINITTLDNRNLRISIDSIIKPKQLKQIYNQGMPDSNGRKGSLFIRFNILFPLQIKQQIKNELRKLLQ